MNISVFRIHIGLSADADADADPGIQQFKTWNFFPFLFFLVIFTLLDPDPDPLMPRLFRFYCMFDWYSIGTDIRYRYVTDYILKISTANVNYNYLVSALNEITGIISQGSWHSFQPEDFIQASSSNLHFCWSLWILSGKQWQSLAQKSWL